MRLEGRRLAMATRQFELIFSIMLAMALALAPAQAMPRLPRTVFDVIPPSDRVTGTRGTMAVYQPACRIGPTIQARRRIVDVAVQEWAFFGFQTIDAAHEESRVLPEGLVPDALNPALSAPRIARQSLRLGTFEDEPDVDTTISGYWSATPDGARVIAAQNQAWTAPGGEAVNWTEPWSAAFVSWVMCEAGLGDMAQFQRSIAHRDYIDQAIRARDGQAPDAAYIAYDAGDQPVEPGDLLCNSRGGTDYRSLADRRRQLGIYAPLHCDVVVKATADRILVIGGNVLQSVSLTILPVTRDPGRYARPVAEGDIEGARTIFAHLKLRASPIELNALDSSPTIKALKAE
jgi:hypothetical protein